MLERGLQALDEGKQEEIYNRIDEVVARSVAFLPLYQVPNVLVWRTRVAGIEHGLSGDPVMNSGDWFVTDR